MGRDPGPDTSRATAHPIYSRLLFLLLLFRVLPGTGAELEQDPLIIKGDQTSPRTLYIAPWKRVGEPLQSRPLELELGQETTPVERDLFLRKLQLQRNGFSVESPPAALPGGDRGAGLGNAHYPSQE